jgi:hypothetical protein
MTAAAVRIEANTIINARANQRWSRGSKVQPFKFNG